MQINSAKDEVIDLMEAVVTEPGAVATGCWTQLARQVFLPARFLIEG